LFSAAIFQWRPAVHESSRWVLFGRPDSIMSEPRSAMAAKGISRGDFLFT